MANETGLNSATPIAVMQRYELKYILSASQSENLLARLQGHMLLDCYGRTSIASLYYDTPDSRLVRSSLEKPKFKEKMRLRSYGMATPESPVFLELKRKADDIVYKRRVQSTVPAVDAKHHAPRMSPYLLQHSGAGRHVPEDAAVPDGPQRHRSDDEHIYALRFGGCA